MNREEKIKMNSQKVYCKKCDHCSSHDDVDSLRICLHPNAITISSDYYESIPVYMTYCSERNKDNNCPDFEPTRIVRTAVRRLMDYIIIGGE